MRTRDFAVGGVFLALGLASAYLTGGLPERSLPHTPGPAFFPWVVTVAILALAALLILRSAFAAREEAGVEAVGGRDSRRAMAALAAFAAYLALLPDLGFVIATAPLFAVLMALYGERRPVTVAAWSLAATAGFYVLFRHAFQIILPQGVLTGLVP